MEILKDAGNYEILNLSEDPINDIAKAARTCYQSQDKASVENNLKLVRNIMKRGHHAMIEFADMTVQFNDVCRGFTHEMVRHRPVSYAQESTRYVDESDFRVVVPPHKDENAEVMCLFDKKDGHHMNLSLADWFELNEKMYRSLREHGWAAQDARQVLPIATKSQIVVKANLREWRHIFDMRTSKYAHWEIRRVMCNLLETVKTKVPIIFDDFVEGGMDANGLRFFQMGNS